MEDVIGGDPLPHPSNRTAARTPNGTSLFAHSNVTARRFRNASRAIGTDSGTGYFTFTRFHPACRLDFVESGLGICPVQCYANPDLQLSKQN